MRLFYGYKFWILFFLAFSLIAIVFFRYYEAENLKNIVAWEARRLRFEMLNQKTSDPSALKRLTSALGRLYFVSEDGRRLVPQDDGEQVVFESEVPENLRWNFSSYSISGEITTRYNGSKTGILSIFSIPYQNSFNVLLESKKVYILLSCPVFRLKSQFGAGDGWLQLWYFVLALVCLMLWGREHFLLHGPIKRLYGKWSGGGDCYPVPHMIESLDSVIVGRELSISSIEQLHAFLFGAIPLGVLILDKDRLIQECSCDFQNMCGYSEQELIGVSLFSVFPRVGSKLKEMGEDTRSFEIDLQLRKSDGEILDVYLRVFRFPKESRFHEILFMEDISREKQLEQEMKNAYKVAELAGRVKVDFVARMSHELRTPLNGVVASVALLGETELNQKQKKYLERIQFSSNVLLSLIEDILDFSRLESGKLILEEKDFCLQDCLRELVDMFRSSAGEPGALKLFFQSDPRLPQMTRGDEIRLKQVLMNLVGNSIKFTQKGYISVNVDLLQESEDWINLKFSVKDTGPGIAQEKLAVIFDSFEKAHTNEQSTAEGAGLGLAICKKFVELMGGEIWVESNLGQGSTFSFTCKLQKSSVSKELFQKKASENAVTVANYDDERELCFQILVAEDNLLNQEIARDVFHQLGHNVTVVGNGKDAVDSLKHISFDFMFLDLQMPVLGGLEAAELICSQYPQDRPVLVALTADVTVEGKRACFEAGLDDYLSKPVLMEHVRDLIFRWRGRAFQGGGQNMSQHIGDSLIDEEIIGRIRLEILPKMIEIFRTQSVKQVSNIISALHEEEAELSVEAAAHSLKSTCLNLGLMSLAKLCEKIEYQRFDKTTIETELQTLYSSTLHAISAYEEQEL